MFQILRSEKRYFRVILVTGEIRTPPFCRFEGKFQRSTLFETEQLAEFYHALASVYEQDETLSFERDQALAELRERVGRLLPEAALRQRDTPEQSGMTMK